MRGKDQNLKTLKGVCCIGSNPEAKDRHRQLVRRPLMAVIVRTMIFLAILLFSNPGLSFSQAIEDFSSEPLWIGSKYNAKPKAIPSITIDGVPYIMIALEGQEWAYETDGGEANSASIKTDFPRSSRGGILIAREDFKPFKFYGVWLKFTKDPSDSPSFGVDYGGGISMLDYPLNEQITLNKPEGITVSRVEIHFTSIKTATVDNLIVGPIGATGPVINTQPVNKEICSGGNTTFSVVASDATEYKWQVNTGSGFTDINNEGVYSGANSSTLTVTKADADMNGHTYQCLVSGAESSSATSNIATLTVSNLTATSSQINVYCNGGTNGSATVTASGGSGEYTYEWSPFVRSTASISGLSTGTYTCTITDENGCFVKQSVTITDPAALTATAVQVNVSCNGGTNGSATVTATGGNGSYSYAWSPSGGNAATASGLAAGRYTCTVTDVIGCSTTETVTITQPAGFTIATSQTNVTCNNGSNGSATVTASGGSGEYTYIWTPVGGTAATATGLTAGNYTCTITDAKGCTASRNFTITQPAALIAATVQTNVSCNGGTNGSASVVVSRGTGAYTYSWSSSGGTASTATGLTSGNYACTITDASGCSLIKNFTITQPPALSVTPAQVNVSCNGGSNGSASVSVTGGTGSYTYSWSPTGGNAPSATGLSVGTYTCTITDANGCFVKQSVTLTQPAGLQATSTQANITCNGGSNGSATVTATGGNGSYSYTWSPSGGTAATASGLAAGKYTCTITDVVGCLTSLNVIINQPAAFNISVSQANVSCNGSNDGSASVRVSGGTAPYTYSWSPSGGTAATASGLAPGSYTCTITDANGCSVMKSFNITEPAALTATTAQTNVSCNGGTNGSASVTVSGGMGAYSYSWSPSGGTASTASGLMPGVYTCTVTDINGCLISRKFTITQPEALKAGVTKTNVTIVGGKDGSASLTPIGGTAPFTYSWSPSGGTASKATALAAGDYTCVATDANGCTVSYTFNVIEPALLGTFSIPAAKYGDAPFKISDPKSNSSAAFTYTSSNTDVATIDGNIVTVLTPGTSTITATQARSTSHLPNSINTIFTVGRKDINLTVLPGGVNTKVYDGNVSATLAATNFKLHGVVGTDDVSVIGTGEYDSKNVGLDKAIHVDNFILTGSTKDYYDLKTKGKQVAGSITKKAITSRSAGVAKTYDGTTVANVNFSALTTEDGLVGSDDLRVQYSSAAYDTKDAGTAKPVTFTGLTLSGSDKDNYLLNSVAIKGTIAPKGITVTAGSGKTKVYGSADPEFTYSITSGGALATGDAFTGSLKRTAGENAGIIYAIGQGSLSAGNNYAITYVPADFTITAKPIAIAAIANTKIYGDADPALVYSVTPALVSGDNFTGALLRAAGKNVGEYAISTGSLSAGSNYKVTTFTPATFTITPAPLVITAEDKTKTQGTANPVFTFRYDGFKGGDAPSNLTGAVQAQTTAVTGSPIGYYDIVASGATSSNYTIRFATGKLSVLPAGNNNLKAWTSSSSILQIRVYTEAPQKAFIMLYTDAGQPVRTLQPQLIAGVNGYTMNVSNLAPGVYILNVNADNFKETLRIKIK